MKNYLTLFLFVILCSCSKKTHVADSNQLETKQKFKHDSSAFKTFSSIDKTIILTTKVADTSITITGKTLNGFLRAPNFKNDTSANFENEDISLILSINKFGFASFKAQPKSKTVPFKILERTKIYNDITTDESAKTQTKKSADVISTLEEKHSEKQTIPSEMHWLKIVLLAAVAAVLIWVFRNLNFLKIL